MPHVLVTGGAGYIGAHTVRRLLAAGHAVSVLDDLSAGRAQALPAGVPLYRIDLAEAGAAQVVLRETVPDAVVHLAGAIEAGRSMTEPGRFYRCNVVGSLALADALVAGVSTASAEPAGVVYSSSAAIYGDPVRCPIHEEDPKDPTSVYGQTKLDTERMFAAYDRAHGLRSIALRYFNAAGATRSGDVGEAHKVETHLIPLAIAAALGRSGPLTVYGTDYPTPDGTCIRDYVHVDDLADAHVLAVAALLDGTASAAYNVGVGGGFSVREVLDSVARIAGTPVPHTTAGRRPGDPARLVADPTRIGAVLGWRPRFTDLDSIVTTALAWHASQGPTASAAASKNP